MEKRHIVAFQDAAKYLGPDFSAVSEKCPGYEEKPRQIIQLNRLFMNRTDAIILDINIFKYYKQKLIKDSSQTRIDPNQSVTVHRIFPPTEYKIAFTAAGIRDDFNKGLKKLKEDLQYMNILKQYVGTE